MCRRNHTSSPTTMKLTQSDDEISSFGVHSIASDTESTPLWEASHETEDVSDYEPGSFRMPAPTTAYTPRCAPAPGQTVKAVKLPQLKSSDSSKDIEFITFAPNVIAREICAILQKASNDKQGTSVGYYDGSGVCHLSGSVAARPTIRVALLYFSTVDSYDPIPEYDQFVQDNGSIPCTPITDKFIDPFSMTAGSIIYSDRKTLLEVKMVDNQSAFMPVSISNLQSLNPAVLVPERKSTYFLSGLNAPKTKVPLYVTLPTLLSVFLVLTSVYEKLYGTSPLAFTPNSKRTLEIEVYEHSPGVFLRGDIFRSMQEPQSAAIHPILAASDHSKSLDTSRFAWTDPFHYLNSAIDSVEYVFYTSFHALSALVKNTLGFIDATLSKTTASLDKGLQKAKASSKNGFRATKSGAGKCVQSVAGATTGSVKSLGVFWNQLTKNIKGFDDFKKNASRLWNPLKALTEKPLVQKPPAPAAASWFWRR